MAIGLSKGVIMTVEASFAALILFGILLLIATLSSLQADYPSTQNILNAYSMDTISALQGQGAFDQIIRFHSDAILRSTLNAYQPSLCMQIEIYTNNASAQYLNYSYTSQNCTITQLTPKTFAYRSFAIRENSSFVSFYWVKAVAYPRG